MPTYQIDLVDDQVLHIVVSELRECYISNATIFKHEPESEKLGDALLEVIQHYSHPDEFERWYDTVKDL